MHATAGKMPGALYLFLCLSEDGEEYEGEEADSCSPFLYKLGFTM